MVERIDKSLSISLDEEECKEGPNSPRMPLLDEESKLTGDQEEQNEE